MAKELLKTNAELKVMSTNDVDRTSIIYSITNITKDRKYKEQKIKEIIAATCALLNSDGGTVELHGKEIEDKKSSFSQSSFIRTVEQAMISIIGPYQTVSNLKFNVTDWKGLEIRVHKAQFLITINYNLYLPSETQVVPVSNEFLEIIKKYVINRTVVEDPVLLGSHLKYIFKNQNLRNVEDKITPFKLPAVTDSHRKPFSKDQYIALGQNKATQFKLLKSDSSKRTTFADRMVGKSNKFSCYVSAFANYKGGHIYYGITDDGIVQGEHIPTKEGICEIEKKVHNAINKMIWPEWINQPKRGQHWDVFFEPVVDENSNTIPSLFVIVVFISSCPGGVFTEEPECYEMVKKRVEKMSFSTWKKRIQQPDGCTRKQEVPFKVDRVSMSSKIKRLCTKTDEVLMEAINNGQWQQFSKIAYHIKQSFPEIEVNLVVLSKEVMLNYRQGFFGKAKNLLTEYERLSCQAEQPLVFEVIFLYLEAALARGSRDFDKVSVILTDALAKAEFIQPGLVTNAVHTFAATVYEMTGINTSLPPDQLSIRALEHLKYVEDSPIVRADMEQKAHITLATYKLGYSMLGKVARKDVNQEDLAAAKSSIMELNRSVLNGNLLNRYRKIQFNLAQSVLYYRYSSVEPERENRFLEEAFNYSKKAEYLSRDAGFTEIISWAQSATALFTEKLLRSRFAKMRRRKDACDENDFQQILDGIH